MRLQSELAERTGAFLRRQTVVFILEIFVTIDYSIAGCVYRPLSIEHRIWIFIRLQGQSVSLSARILRFASIHRLSSGWDRTFTFSKVVLMMFSCLAVFYRASVFVLRLICVAFFKHLGKHGIYHGSFHLNQRLSFGVALDLVCYNVRVAM